MSERETDGSVIGKNIANIELIAYLCQKRKEGGRIMAGYGNGDLKPKYDTCFFERYAKETLADLVSPKYGDLVNRDRPDLQDTRQGIGIEVTRAMRESKKDATEMINEIAGETVVNVPQDIASPMQTYGYGFVLNSQYIGTKEKEYWNRALPLQHIIESKVQKVGSGFYGQFKEFGLYVFSKERQSSQDVVLTMEWMMTIQKDMPHKYEYLFLSQCEELWTCNLKNKEALRYAMPKEKRHEYYEKATLSAEDHASVQKEVERLNKQKNDKG